MANTSDFLKRVWLKSADLNRSHPLALFVVLLLCATPLPLGFSNVALVLLSLAGFWFGFKTRHFRSDGYLLLPVLLYLWMLSSLFWTVDPARTQSALSKEIALLLVPVAFASVPVFSTSIKQKVLLIYARFIVIFAGVCVLVALFKFADGAGSSVFFYHGLVGKELNAIHVSVYGTMALAVLFAHRDKSRADYFSIGLLLGFLALLSSKNIMIVAAFLCVVYALFWWRAPMIKKIVGSAIIAALLLMVVLAVPSVKQRFAEEINSAIGAGNVHRELSSEDGNVYYVTPYQAWTAETFAPNDYFPGTAFRVYQFRIFVELLQEDPIFWTGYGLNASYAAIERKAKERNLFAGNDTQDGYGSKNFHNQYAQQWADLGLPGLLLLLSMLGTSLFIGLKRKDFVHISFTVLMISLFLTESFLWRQRGVIFFTGMYCLLNSGIAFKKRL